MPTESPFATATSQPTVEFDVQAGVALRYLEAIKVAVSDYWSYLIHLQVPFRESPLKVVVMHDVESWSRQQNSRQGYVGDQLEAKINEDVEFWSGAAGVGGTAGLTMRVDYAWGTEFVYEVVVHELTHVYQHQLASSAYPDAPTGLSSEPVWLTEGMATLFEDLIASHSRGVPFRDWGAASSATDACATELEDVAYYGLTKYTTGRQASLLLASMFGVRGLFDLYTKSRPNESFGSAFRRILGLELDDFYNQFAEYCADGMPPLDVDPIVDYPGSLLPLEPWKPSCQVVYPIDLRDADSNRMIVALNRICDWVERIGWLTYDSRVFIHGDAKGLSDLLMGAGEGSYNLDGHTVGTGPSGRGFVTYLMDGLNGPIHGWMILDATYHFARSMLFGGHPAWLQEGLARAMPPLAVGCAGGWDYPHSADSRRVALEFTSGLSSLETWDDNVTSGWLGIASHVGQEAMELLIATYGPQEVGTYLNLAREIIWEDRFESAFGIPAVEFYQLYHRHREAGLPDVPVSAC